MRSIRLSLILCILVLLVLSLLTVSVLAYHEAQVSLLAKKTSMGEMLKASYEEERRRELEKLDKALLADARVIANSVTVKIEFPDKRLWSLNSLGALIAGSAPQGQLFVLSWVGEYSQPGLLKEMRDKAPQFHPTVKLKSFSLPPEEVNNPSKYFQIDTFTGDEARSHSMEDFRFDFDPSEFSNHHSGKNTPLVEENASDALMGDVKVRLVRAKFTRFAVSFPFPKFTKGKGFASGGDKTPPPAPQPNPPSMSLFVQVATDLEPLETKLAFNKAKKDEELAQLENESSENLDTLRNRFLLIGGMTLLVAVLGGFLVVQWGLSPVKRLSEAVSQVSEKDFHLPLNAKQLPSELRPIAERLTQTLDLLRRAFAREKQAAADISHELRTPLAAMLATIDVTLRKPRAAEEYHEVLGECRTTGLQMSQLVERMLALARLDAGADHLHAQEVDVARLADQCSAMVRPLAEARGLRMHVAHEGSALIKADPDKIREILTNLLHNAIEYNKPEGNIDVSVQRINGYLEMQVRDTGIGIAPDAQQHIFERFFRADSSRHAEGVHAGIGLALVKGYVDLMGGRISLESVEGAGTTFTIQLPADQNGES